MSKKKIAGICTGAAAGAMAVTAHIMKKKAEKSNFKKEVNQRAVGLFLSDGSFLIACL